jgi:hypothetical protein
MRLFIFIFLLCFPQVSIAEVFQVKGDTLFYNMEYTYGKQPIKLGHDDQLLKVLEKNKNIKSLKLESSGLILM